MACWQGLKYTNCIPPLKKMGVLDDTNQALELRKKLSHSFIAITPRFILAWNGSTS